jgi:hypothetical protein
MPILGLIFGLNNVAWRAAFDLRRLAMKELLVTRLRLAVVTAKLCGPGGVRAVAAENLVLKQQLIVLRRDRRRAANLTLSDRLLCGFASLFLSSGRIRKVTVALRPSTLLAFHQALARGKYRWLFSSTSCPRKPGPTGRTTHSSRPSSSSIGTLGQPETLQEISVPAPARRVPDAETVECSDRPFGAVAEFG